MLRAGHPVPVTVAELGIDGGIDKAPVTSAIHRGLIGANLPHDNGVLFVRRIPVRRGGDLRYKCHLRALIATRWPLQKLLPIRAEDIAD